MLVHLYLVYVQQTNILGGNSTGKRSTVNTLNLNPPVPDPIIVHPGIVVAILQLLPSIQVVSSIFNMRLHIDIGNVL